MCENCVNYPDFPFRNVTLLEAFDFGKENLKMKRLLSIFMALVLGICCATTTFAQDIDSDAPQIPTPRYTGISSYYANLDSDGNDLILSGGIVPVSGYTVKLTIDMQERNGYSGTWHTVDTYTDTGTDREICSIYETYKGKSGNSYRGYCTFQAFDSRGNVVDEKHHYTAIMFL